MILIVGLGNPGKKYQKTRHNIGFRVVDELRSSSRFTTTHAIDKLKSLNLKGVMLAKPKTFMNLSGKEVKSLVNKYKILTANLWVIHDDIDLPLGKIRIVKNRGSAGHKGIESVIRELKTNNFVRFREGIKVAEATPHLPPRLRSANKELRIKNTEKFVLEKFSKKEEKIVKETIKKTVEAVEFFLREGLEKAMNKYNK